jgi:hypothetical protein
MFMLRKSDWDIQKLGLILFLVDKLVQRSRATKPETPDSRLPTPDDRLLTPNPTNKLFQQTLNKEVLTTKLKHI